MTQKNSLQKRQKTPRRGTMVSQVVDNKDFGHQHRSITLSVTGPDAQVLAQSKAGQFVQLACRDLNKPQTSTPLLRRPFSIARLETSEQQTAIEVIYQLLGPGTEWLSQRDNGDQINLLGPLGNGFTLPKDKKQKIILIGGGVGLPPLYFLASQLKQAGFTSLMAFAGVQTIDRLVGSLHRSAAGPADPLQPTKILDQFAQSDTDVIISTDDGSYGFTGHAEAALKAFLKKDNTWQQAQVYSCGPYVMLKGIASLASSLNMPCQVCMEAYMSCGIGICQSCAIAMQEKPATKQTGTEDRKSVV